MDGNERVIVSTPGFLRKLTATLAVEPKRNVANYIMWRAAESMLGHLSKVSYHRSPFTTMYLAKLIDRQLIFSKPSIPI